MVRSLGRYSSIKDVTYRFEFDASVAIVPTGYGSWIDKLANSVFDPF